MTTTSLTESEYDALAHPELEALVAKLDEIPGNLEAELASDILTIEFSDGSRYVLNSHRAARQIWLAAEHSAWHFDFQGGQRVWVAAKTGDELWGTLARLLSQKLGAEVLLTRR